jgi:hypothetical protein
MAPLTLGACGRWDAGRRERGGVGDVDVATLVERQIWMEREAAICYFLRCFTRSKIN